MSTRRLVRFVSLRAYGTGNLAMKPDFRSGPFAFYCCRRHADDFGGFFDAEPAEISQLDDLALARIKLGKALQASSSATILAAFPSASVAASSSETLRASPPRLARVCPRACSTRMRRIACAATAKK